MFLITEDYSGSYSKPRLRLLSGALAPSILAAANMHGATPRGFFGVLRNSSEIFETNKFTVEWSLHMIRNQNKIPYLIIDEYSMISATTLESISNCLYSAVLGIGPAFEPFGHLPIVIFGDLGQMEPIIRADVSEHEANQQHTDPDTHEEWIWNAEDFYSFEQLLIVEPCRQAQDQCFQSFLRIIREGPHGN
ncbi:hypothetical protein BGX26_012306 [Mortierella sp. AD094]|nr:hypothetical protein BGX26_012306 [Mortierella sp. AD094]